MNNKYCLNVCIIYIKRTIVNFEALTFTKKNQKNCKLYVVININKNDLYALLGNCMARAQLEEVSDTRPAVNATLWWCKQWRT